MYEVRFVGVPALAREYGGADAGRDWGTTRGRG